MTTMDPMDDNKHDNKPPVTEGSAEKQADPASAPTGAPAVAQNEGLEAKVARLEREKAESHDRMLRALADFENYKRRSRREIDEAATRGREALLKELLPVLDNLERALAARGQRRQRRGARRGACAWSRSSSTRRSRSSRCGASTRSASPSTRRATRPSSRSRPRPPRPAPWRRSTRGVTPWGIGSCGRPWWPSPRARPSRRRARPRPATAAPPPKAPCTGRHVAKAGLLRDPRCLPLGRRGRAQARIPRAGDALSPRQEPGRPRRRGEVQAGLRGLRRALRPREEGPL